MPPIPHPHDKPLLKPLSALGKNASNANGVSFLRRTEYIASDQARNRHDTHVAKEISRNGHNAQDPRKRRKLDDTSKDDPSRIVSQIEAGFRLANGEHGLTGVDAMKPAQEAISSWNYPVHPSKPGLTLLDAYPLLPDPDANTDIGHYRVVKFYSNPSSTTDKYDKRLDCAVLNATDPSLEKQEIYQTQQAAHAADPTQPDPGAPKFDYMLYLVRDEEHADDVIAETKRRIGQTTGQSIPEEDEEAEKNFEYRYVGLYETYQQSGSTTEFFNDTVALALRDSNQVDGRQLQKGAYIYPVDQKTHIRPSRSRNITASEGKVDIINLALRVANEEELAFRQEKRSLFEVQEEVEASEKANTSQAGEDVEAS